MSLKETSDQYINVVLTGRNIRIIIDQARLQWIIQKYMAPSAEVPWWAASFITERDSLIRHYERLEPYIKSDSAVLTALPPYARQVPPVIALPAPGAYDG